MSTSAERFKTLYHSKGIGGMSEDELRECAQFVPGKFDGHPPDLEVLRSQVNSCKDALASIAGAREAGAAQQERIKEGKAKRSDAWKIALIGILATLAAAWVPAWFQRGDIADAQEKLRVLQSRVDKLEVLAARKGDDAKPSMKQKEQESSQPKEPKTAPSARAPATITPKPPEESTPPPLPTTKKEGS